MESFVKATLLNGNHCSPILLFCSWLLFLVKNTVTAKAADIKALYE